MNVYSDQLEDLINITRHSPTFVGQAEVLKFMFLVVAR